MKALQAVFAALAVLVAVFFVGGMFLPAEWEDSSRLEICADDRTVFAAMNRPDSIAEWSVLNTDELEARMDGDAGAGSRLEWRRTDRGDGNGEFTHLLEIEESDPHSRIVYRLEQDERMLGRGVAELESVEAERTSVRITIHPQVETIGGRWVGLMSRLQRDMSRLAATELENIAEYLDAEC